MLHSTTTPSVKNSTSVQGYIVYSQFYNLPKKRILYLSCDEDRTKTILKVFSMDDLKTCLVERNMTEEYDLLGIFPDGNILLREMWRGQVKPSLVKISPDTLETLSIQPGHPLHIGIIDNDSFFTLGANLTSHTLTIYKWDTENKTYAIHINTQPFAELKNLPDCAGQILSLGKNRYGCKLTARNSKAFKVVIFDINPKKNYETKVYGVIQPTEFPGHDSCSTGRMVALPNGQLLTYHRAYVHPADHLQIWNTATLECVKDWTWEKIRDPGYYSEIQAFPDSIHLLYKYCNTCYIFNIDTLIAKKINFLNSYSLDNCGNDHILTNGQVLAFKDRRYKNNTKNDENNNDTHHDNLEVVHFDLDEMIHYRENRLSKNLVSQRFFRNILVQDVVDDIVSYAFPPNL